MRKKIIQAIVLLVIFLNIYSCIVIDSPHYYRHRHWHRYYVPHPHYHGTGYHD